MTDVNLTFYADCSNFSFLLASNCRLISTPQLSCIFSTYIFQITKMGAGASVVTKEEVEKLPQYTILGGNYHNRCSLSNVGLSEMICTRFFSAGDAKFDEMKDGEGKVSIENVSCRNRIILSRHLIFFPFYFSCCRFSLRTHT